MAPKSTRILDFGEKNKGSFRRWEGALGSPVTGPGQEAPQLSGAYLNAVTVAPGPCTLKLPVLWPATGPTAAVCVPTTVPDLSRKSILSEYEQFASPLFRTVPPRLVSFSVTANSANVTRAGSFCIVSLYLRAESSATRLESASAWSRGWAFAAESMYAAFTLAAVDAFARLP